MKRFFALILSLTLLLTMLSGCGAGAHSDYVDMVVFDEMEYTRPDLDEALAHIDAARDALSGMEGNRLKQLFGLRKVAESLETVFADYYHIETMMTLSRIRADRNVTDTYYNEEYAFCSDAMVTYYAEMEEVFTECAASDGKGMLEKYVLGEGFLDDYGEDYVISDTLTELRRRENELVTQYYSVLNSASVDIQGVSYDIDALYDAVDAGTLGEDAYSLYYSAVNAELGAIYIDLVRVREAMADELGYDDYREMAYDENGYDYDLDEVAAYTKAIQETIVPLFVEAHESNQLTDAYYGTEKQESEDSLDAVAQMAETLGGDFAEAMEFLMEYDLCDVAVSDVKSPDSYEIYLSDWEAPYLFTDSIGYAEDTLTIAHEFGHFTDDFIYYGAYHGTDTSETLSQGLEYLSLTYLPDDDLRESLTRWKLADVLQLYAQQGSFNAFEEQVYALSDQDLTLENVNAIALQTARDYGLESSYGETYDATSWVEITHFFEQPFYILSYLTSDSAAIQFYEQELQKEGAGLELYKKVQNAADDYSFTELMTHYGLRDPLSKEQVQAIADLIRAEFLQ